MPSEFGVCLLVLQTTVPVKGLVAEMTSDYDKTFSFLFLIKTIKHAWPDLSREEH